MLTDLEPKHVLAAWLGLPDDALGEDILVSLRAFRAAQERLHLLEGLPAPAGVMGPTHVYSCQRRHR